MLSFLDRLGQLVDERCARGLFVLTPRIVAAGLGTDIPGAVRIMEEYRSKSIRPIQVYYRAMCPHCSSPNTVNSHWEEIRKDVPFDIRCESCWQDYEARSTNIVLEYVVHCPSGQSSKDGVRGGSDDPPRRTPGSTEASYKRVADDCIASIPPSDRPHVIHVHPGAILNMNKDDHSIRQEGSNSTASPVSGSGNTSTRDGNVNAPSRGLATGWWVAIAVAVIGAVATIVAAFLGKP